MTEENKLPWDEEGEPIEPTEGAEPSGEDLEPITEADGAADPADVLTEQPKRTRWRVTLADVMAKIDKGDYIPIPSNIPFIDDLTGGGFVPGTVSVIVADPGAGKTALCQQMAAQFARNGHIVTFINYEMDEAPLYARDLAREVRPPRSGKDGDALRFYDPTITPLAILRGDLSPARNKVAEEKAKRFREAVEDLEEHVYANLIYRQFIQDTDPETGEKREPRPIRNTIDDLRALTSFNLRLYEQRKAQAEADPEAGKPMAKKRAATHAPILFVDYIQLIAGASDSKINTLEEITGILTDYAQRGQTIVFAVSSANRASRSEARKEAMKQTKAAAKNQDNVISFDDEIEDDGKEAPMQPVYIYVDKARLAAPKRLIKAQFIGAAAKFVQTNNDRPRRPTDKEAGQLLTMTAGAGASVLEYSASYFISLNNGIVSGGSGGGSGRPKADGPSIEEMQALINDDAGDA